MTTLALTEGARERIRVHAPIDEYDTYLERCTDDPVYRRMLRHYRDEFIATYPDVELWFAAHLFEKSRPRVDAGRRAQVATSRLPSRAFIHPLSSVARLYPVGLGVAPRNRATLHLGTGPAVGTVDPSRRRGFGPSGAET